MATKVSTLEINPLGHITSSLAISQYNYESILNALVEWDQSRMDKVTVRLATNTDPYFVDYVIPTRHYADSSGGENAVLPLLDAGKFSINEMHHVSTSYDPENPDTVVVRVSPRRDFEKSLRLCAVPVIYDETTEGDGEDASFYVATEYSSDYPKNAYFAVCTGYATSATKPAGIAIRRTTVAVSAGDDITDSNSMPMVAEYESGKTYKQDQLVRYAGTVYVLNGDRDAAYFPDNPKSNFVKYCDCYSPDGVYEYGSLVEYGGMIYAYTFGTSSSVPPFELMTDEEDPVGTLVENSSYWTRFFPVNAHFYVRSGGTLRYTPETDLSGFVVYNSGSEALGETDSVRIHSSIRIPAGHTVQPKGVDILPSCNYVQYPDSTTPRWITGRTYGPTDASTGVYGLQDYTSVMVFNHASADVSRVNIVNYDGPDLDQGLAVFLPVNIVGSNNEVVSPKDGCIFEFLFRIWPNTEWTGAAVNDLIVNKAHIYVYNVVNYNDVDFATRKFDSSNVWPLAKFSMARMTNFYLFGENVAVPDKPVVYKARFIYSAAENAWQTFDYYQLPDQVFMSPNGFTDAAETGGFPMFQDPFSNSDLSPIRIGEEYFGRMKHTAQET